MESRAQGVKSKAVENQSQAEVGLSPNQGTSNTCLEGFLGLLWNFNSSVPPVFSSLYPLGSWFYSLSYPFSLKRNSCLQLCSLSVCFLLLELQGPQSRTLSSKTGLGVDEVPRVRVCVCVCVCVYLCALVTQSTHTHTHIHVGTSSIPGSVLDDKILDFELMI